MTDTTLDEARRCPTCNELGATAGTKKLERHGPLDSGGTLHIFKCRNERCRRFDRDWVVQIRPDGTIPKPTTNRQKSFPTREGVFAKQQIQQAQAYTDQLANTTEIPNYR